MLRIIIVTLLLALSRAGAAELVFDWSGMKANELPKGFRPALSGTGQPGEWKIIFDEAPTAFPAISPKAVNRNVRPVLAQVSKDRTDARYPMLLLDGETFDDFTLTTQFKIVDGTNEQMAGIAFRIQDEANYYYVRASALGSNVNFFKMENGQLIGPIGAKAEIAKGAWQELTIECQGNQIKFSLNGTEVVPPLRDNTFNSGKIGFWTKSDSVSYFGDTRIVFKPRERLAQSLVQDAIKKYPRLQRIKISAPATVGAEPKVIASTDLADVGKPAKTETLDVITRGIIYHGEDKGNVHVTMPLKDSNGDRIAAVEVVMKAFPGQTEKNAITRAMPIVKQIEARVRNSAELMQ
jgi:hypothetical protein